jgi:3-carboxy-cis,cis-muconate cycloisomerase
MSAEPTSLRIPEPGIRELYTLESRWQSWLDVEAALAKAEAELGMIPAAAAQEICAKAKVELLDHDNIVEGLRRTAHQLVPLVWELSRVCDGDAGNYVHWGATTQNITQTGEILLLRKAHQIFLRQLGEIFKALAPLARRSRDFALPGRTHGQHAVPATFGFKVGIWIDELARHVERLRGAQTRVFVAMLGGAAGTYASFGEHGEQVQHKMAAHLDLTSMPVPARTVLDHLAEYVTLMALLAATCGKIGQEVYIGMKDEFGELEEPWSPGTVGSSTMPQKRNPFLSQDVIAGASRIRNLVPLALEAMQVEHEANRANTLLMRKAVEPACEILGDTLERVRAIVSGLTVDEARMRRNLDLSGGLILGEALMLRLGEQVGRQEAHDIIYDAAQAAAMGEQSFQTLLSDDPRVAAHISADEVNALLDPTAYTGRCAAIADEQADRADALAAELLK